jgi:hypothetical protein
MNKKILFAMPIIGMFILALVVIPLTVWQVKNTENKQDTRSKAASPTGQAILSFSPATSETIISNSVTSKIPIDLKFYTPITPNNKGIIGIKAVFTFDPNILSLTLSDIVFNSSLKSTNSTQQEQWTINRQEVNAGTVVIEATNWFASDYGYTGAVQAPKTLVTLNFTPKVITQNSGTSNLTFDIARSAIYAKDNSDILSQNLTNGGPYKLYLDNTAPDTTITNPTSCPASFRNLPITFTFAGTDTRNDNVSTPVSKFEYRLTPSTAWTETTETSASFSNLALGTYTFEVRAKDSVNNVDSTPASCTFTYAMQTNLQLKLKFDGLSSATPAPLHYPKTIIVTLRNQANPNLSPFSATANYDSSFNGYKANIVLPNTLTSASYEVLVKGPWHLRKNLGTVQITQNSDNVLDRNSDNYKLLRGDLVNDNIIQMNDITAILSVWNQSEVPVANETMRKYDLTEDGKISLNDITAILSNWLASETPGDN